ncbi:deoxyguanosinetriphosphate triphosphohydrolase [Marivibrio halodurans]|uniref:Deoxyguanosinetriphosphate triphosphohydrolase-like protein n=1 Tax=Marivibrio halodurans TaxID=2039722 RepID=A0A8J7SGI2_9PROT|nr:deoxyguanosinetriphosphate triphosphohydrolase [Marivibrio halodurans]MBP5855743.1 deoxyguanosinetriphosphate triphosphohydrolase [Marivibrio halodurans]
MTPERAAYATMWEESRGRFHDEAPSETRTPFQRDRDRIVHCSAFRRLGHKTQVFISPEGDHIRTRLTHSLEVAQIARSIARALGADEDLTEAIALAHDLGHTPFGHVGEDALDEIMQPFGGFDHNDQALRILTRLEMRYPTHPGLNLTWEALEGVVKHNGPVRDDPLPLTLSEVNAGFDLEVGTHAGLEAQIAAISDDIAYNHHDMDDGLRARLFTIGQVREAVPHVDAAFASVDRDYVDLPRPVRIAEAVRRLIGEMVADVLAEARRRLAEAKPENAAALRAAGRQMVAFSAGMAGREKSLKAFLFANMYRAPAVNEERADGMRIIGELFRYYLNKPHRLPEIWRDACAGPFDATTARTVADYIAGMTDRFAHRQYKHLFAGTTRLRLS